MTARLSEAWPPAVARAFRVLVAEPQALPLDQLAARSGISKFHLSRLFVRSLGMPPQRLHRHMRLARAAAMLRAGASSADVAYALGFADQAHLSRCFKAKFGVSPRAYARRGASLLP